jgi:hypothetical protein
VKRRDAVDADSAIEEHIARETQVVDTLWSDISEFQVPVNDDYPHSFLCIRSNDGGHLDKHFAANLDWCKRRRANGHLFGFMVYYFYRPGVDGAAVLRSRVGTPDSRMTVMIDVESANGQVSGNQSRAINAQHDELPRWLGSSKRVVGYGNVSDLNALWPQKPSGTRIVVAAYGSNPDYPGKFAHQFMDNANTRPFGSSDLNSADGMSPNDLLAMFGFSETHPTPPPTQMAGTKSGPKPLGKAHAWVADGTLSLDGVMARRNSRAIVSVALTQDNGNGDVSDAMNNYISGGTTHPMPSGLVFCTANP